MSTAKVAHLSRLLTGAAAFIVAALAGCEESRSRDAYLSREPGSVTFNKDIAPIVFAHCAACHRPSGSAPFGLLTYHDAKGWAQRIAVVTKSRYMPPWLPEPGYAGFAGERRLSDEQIGLIQQWVQEGSVEGDRADLPPAPGWTEGWQLGEPDLVIKMPQPYTLHAGGTEVFRNFAIPIPTSSTRYVRAVELRPGNPKIVHHAVMGIDRTPSSRLLDQQDPEPGFDGMAPISEAHSPNGYFLGWTPGKAPFGGYEGMSWRLEEGTDLVVQLHLRPSGQSEVIAAAVGFYFADRPPRRFPSLLRLGSQTIDIPAGKRDYTIEDSYVLPVDVEVLSVYPHAHYLATEMQGFATLPDGTTRWLIRIKDWDFNWQDEYRYARPIFLPKGTTLAMRYTYDNSDDNVHNPNHPARRVVYGPNSSDEMGDLWIQALPADSADLAILNRDFEHKNLYAQIAGFEHMLRLNPDHAHAHHDLANALQALGKLDEAISHYRQALRLKEDFAAAHYSLGVALQSLGELDEAISHYHQALQVKEEFGPAHNKLGEALQSLGKLDEAISHYRRAVRLRPDDARAHNNLGIALQTQGKLDLAISHYRQALQIRGDLAPAHNNLGIALQSLGKLEEAISHYMQALHLRADYAQAHHNLGIALKSLTAKAWKLATHPDGNVQKPNEALRLAERAAELTQYQNPIVLDALAAAHAATGHFARAVTIAQEAVALASAAQENEVANNIRRHLELYRQGKPYRDLVGGQEAIRP